MIRRVHAAAMARQLGSHVTELLARRLGLLLLVRIRGGQTLRALLAAAGRAGWGFHRWS